MKLILQRLNCGSKPYTIGHLYKEDGTFICDTLEDKDRGLVSSMSLSTLKSMKVKGETAIPKGTYKVLLNVVSQRFKNRKQYQYISGKLPRLDGVPAYEGVLIHIGNTAKDTEGCILVGENKVVGKVINSEISFHKVYDILKSATDEIYLTIK